MIKRILFENIPPTFDGTFGVFSFFDHYDVANLLHRIIVVSHVIDKVLCWYFSFGGVLDFFSLYITAFSLNGSSRDPKFVNASAQCWVFGKLRKPKMHVRWWIMLMDKVYLTILATINEPFNFTHSQFSNDLLKGNDMAVLHKMLTCVHCWKWSYLHYIHYVHLAFLSIYTSYNFKCWPLIMIGSIHPSIFLNSNALGSITLATWYGPNHMESNFVCFSGIAWSFSHFSTRSPSLKVIVEAFFLSNHLLITSYLFILSSKDFSQVSSKFSNSFILTWRGSMLSLYYCKTLKVGYSMCIDNLALKP